MSQKPTGRPWMFEKLERAESRRNWKTLPAAFERDAVKFLYRDFLPYFCQITEIKICIAASKADTFEALRNALNKPRSSWKLD